MRLFLFLLLCFIYLNTALSAQSITGPLGEVFEMKVITKQLSDPWEITYGPDDNLWVTESKGYRVCLVNPVSGSKKLLIDLKDAKNFLRYDKIDDGKDGGKPWPQGGLMGLALHPRLLKDKPYVYLAYVFKFKGAEKEGKGCVPGNGGCFYTTKIVRFTYNSKSQTLSDPISLCDTIPGSNDHNGGRLLIAPIQDEEYLFYSVGDMGAGQFDNGGRPNHAQDINYYEGKILRFNLEQDSDSNAFDQWIPYDNPFNSTSQNAVWSYGHRNPQGLAYAVVADTGRIYSSEHGPFSDDEVNIIEKGKNYGHPLVIGYNDGNYDGLAAAASDLKNLPGKWNTSYPTISSEKTNVQFIGNELYRDPIYTLYANSTHFLTNLLEQIQTGINKEPTWPSEAPSSLDVYTSTAIPGWKNSLLLPTLKGNKLIRLKLNPKGDKITGDTINYFKTKVRYRDIAISPDGLKLYTVIDSSSVTSGPTEENPEKISYRGAIIEFSYKTNTTQKSKKKPNRDQGKQPGILEEKEKETRGIRRK